MVYRYSIRYLFIKVLPLLIFLELIFIGPWKTQTYELFLNVTKFLWNCQKINN